MQTFARWDAETSDRAPAESAPSPMAPFVQPPGQQPMPSSTADRVTVGRSTRRMMQWTALSALGALIAAAAINGLFAWRASVIVGDLCQRLAASGVTPADAQDVLASLALLQRERAIGLACGVLLLALGGLLVTHLIRRSFQTLGALRLQLRQSEDRYRALSNLATDYAYAVVVGPGGDWAIEWATEAFTRITGARAENLNSRERIMALIHPEDRARFMARCKRLSHGQSDVSDLRLVTLHGTVRVVRDYSRPVWDDRERRVVRVYGAAQDITDDKAHEGQLFRKAFSDPLTGLANRTMFMERLDFAVQQAGRDGTGLAVLFVDLDRFKLVNDSLGHAAGDTLLIGVAARLNACVRQDDLVARLGGDELTVLIERLGDEEDVARVAERILHSLRLPFSLGSREVTIGASIGITLRLPGSPLTDANALLREADTALYHAKASGKGRAVTFDARLDAGVEDRLALETELRTAIESRQLVVYYQPEIDLETGSIVGMEALVRWQHPQRGLLPPRELIPLAEETGLIGAIDLWVLEEASRQVKTWQDRTPSLPPLTVSVNLSGQQFREESLARQITQTLAATGLEPSSLRLEITETVLMEDGVAAVNTLRALHDLGVRLAIDDFGTGYSSLSYLQRFPVDTIKIDRSFVTAIARDETTQAIVQAVASLGQSLRLQVTAEGIETAEQWTQVYGAGCRYAQGYYFAAPLPADEMGSLLLSSAGRYRPSRDVLTRARHRAETRWRDRRGLLTDDVLRLPEQFRGVFSSETVERFTREALESLEGSRVQAFLSTLVGRDARERLRALTTMDQIPSGRRARVLFVCVTGAGASPMAAALAERLSDGWVTALAVGSSPTEILDPVVVQAMAEIGVQLRRRAPQPLTEEEVLAADVVVTLGCGDVCPLVPGKRYRDWSIDVPDDLPIDRVREIRDAIQAQVQRLLQELQLTRAA